MDREAARGRLRAWLEAERAFGVDLLPLKRNGARAPAAEAAPAEFEQFRREVLACVKCGLSKARTQVVFGVGPARAPLFFVGEAPGRDEDAQGEPFVGAAGKLFTRILRELGVDREQVYIGNIVKCRPPENRNPLPEEIQACFPYLLKQIRWVKPQIICALGRVAVGALLNTDRPISGLRGKYHERYNLRVFATFHPAYILRNMSQLPVLRQDLRRVCKDAGLIAG